MKLSSEDAWTRGGRIGAALGALIFAGPGIVPSLFLASYGTAVLLGRLGGGTYDPGTGLRIVFVLGTGAGICLFATLMVLGGTALGAVAAYVIEMVRELLGLGAGNSDGRLAQALYMNSHPRMREARREEIRQRLSFLGPVRKDIRSVAVVGSAAYEAQVPGSDIDIVLICSDTGSEHVREFVFGVEIDEAMASGPLTRDLEFTVLSEAETDEVFASGSPFAHAVHKGVWLEDDGFLRNKRPLSALPKREFQLTILHDNVAVQYLGAVASLNRDMKQKGCSDACCRSTSDCAGISPADNLCRTIMRMLYMVLPARGYMPLTKDDAADFAGRVYGEPFMDAVKASISILRARQRTVTFMEYKPLKRFAAVLFRDVLTIIEEGDEARRILDDASSLVHGRYAEIQGAAMRACI